MEDITYYTTSLEKSRKASLNYFGAEVILARRLQPGTTKRYSVVLRSRGHKTRKVVEIGYARFGNNTIWTHKFELPFASDEVVGPERVQSLLEQTVKNVVEIADDLTRATLNA